MRHTHILSRIKVHKASSHEIIPIFFDLEEVLNEKYYFYIKSGVKKLGITVGKSTCA